MPQHLVSLKAGYFERLWGGRRLHDTLGLPAPTDRPIGEAWLVSDHASFESEILNGDWRGLTLHQVLVQEPDFLLGTVARPTVHGRFPLLLKILDANDVLSVQVHPDDEAAARLGEPDVGKTEMWHVLDAEPGSTLICGLDPGLTRASFLAAAADGVLDTHLHRFPAPPGTTAFVAAGTVHAIGAGILLAEIQQNSDLTYRIHDWNRVDSAGNPRTLHLEKAAEVTEFGAHYDGPAQPLTYSDADGPVTVLGACRYFASERLPVQGNRRRNTLGRSFHLLVAADGPLTVASGTESLAIRRGEAVLVPGGAGEYTLIGHGDVLNYFAPNLMEDVVRPLQAAGHDRNAIVRLAGSSAHNDLATLSSA